MFFAGNNIITSGTYYDTLTNAVGCDSIVTLNLTINTSPTIYLGIDTILCSGTTMDLDAGNGFTYLWQDGTNTQTLTATITGAYDVTITDANGCSDSDTINVTLATPLVVTLDSTKVTCNGLTDGTATATVTGGTPNYSYLWDDISAQTTATATNLSAGNYTISVTDDNNCSASNSISVMEPTLLSASVQGPDSIPDFTYLGEYNNQFIYYHNAGLSWPDARQKALNNGGDLYVINDSVEDDFLYNLVYNYVDNWNDGFWIGLYQDLNDPNYLEPAGGWKWVDGTTATYTNWGNGEPSNGSSITSPLENWAHMWGQNNWNDHLLGANFPFIMSVNANQHYALHVSCNGGNDGQTYVTASGGTSPYSYAWDNVQTLSLIHI